MAKKNINLGKTETNSFVKGLNKDSDSSFIQDGMWTHARNVVNNTAEGNLGTLSGEPANYLCATAGETLGGTRKVIIGAIHLFSDKWVVFTAAYTPGVINSVNSEIGLFEEDICKYRIIVQDPCLKFSELNLIYGAAREKEDCSWAVYFNDALNPDRYLNVGDPQTWPPDDFIWIGNNTYSNGVSQRQWPGVAWNQDCETIDSCKICTDLTTLNCDKLRLARLVETPCLNVRAGRSGGTLNNGSYFAVIAYSIKGQKVTDWYSPSNVQPIWFEVDPAGSLEITVNADTENFDEFILVVVSTTAGATVAKQVGIYTTSTTTIYLDQIKLDLPSIPIENLPIQTPVFEKSDQIVETNNYLLRVGPTSKFDFNYQPLANLINAKWVCVEYDSDYYVKGGYKPSYMRDEVYPFFIRWVYDTGDKSSSYHIPGRAAQDYTLPIAPYQVVSETLVHNDINTLYPADLEKVFEIYNTASVTSTPGTVLQDGGLVVAKGNMGYWESTEVYPNNDIVWNSTSNCWTGTTDSYKYDLCGKPIRHHKFPDNVIKSGTISNTITNHYTKDLATGKTKIRILGVEFDNITYPKDNDGNDIPGIVGYEILRGSREGNRTVIAKGMLNNMRPFTLRGAGVGNKKGLYPNHPFNTIRPYDTSLNPTSSDINDPYFKLTDIDGNFIPATISDMPDEVVTFHSPDTNFKDPFLAVSELKLYGQLKGTSSQYFIEPDLQPKQKLLSNTSMIIMFIGGLIEATVSLIGKRTYNAPNVSLNPLNPVIYVPPVSTALTSAATAYQAAIDSYDSLGGLLLDALASVSPVPITTPSEVADTAFITAINTAAAAGAVEPFTTQYTIEYPGWRYLDPVTRTINGLNQFIFYFSEGANVALDLIYAFLPYNQYALQLQAHGFYDRFGVHNSTWEQRFKIQDSFYLKDGFQDVKPYSSGFTTYDYRISNLYRQTTVVVRTSNGNDLAVGPQLLNDGVIPDPDKSLVTLGTAYSSITNGPDFTDDRKTLQFQTNIASHYAAIKTRIRNQYGQLDAIKQVPITPCERKNLNLLTTITSTICYRERPDGTIQPYQLQLTKVIISPEDVYFNGDVYINRYTEKNTMFMFRDWLYGQPDGFPYNYLLQQMLPEPRFWINSQRYDISALNPFPGGTWASFTPTPGAGATPKKFYSVDNENYDYSTNDQGNPPGFFGVKESYFYLASSGIRDFFVESDVIVDFREDGLEQWQKNYDPYNYTDLVSLFNINRDNITRGNYYKYDYSLSISKLFTQYFSQGNLQSRYYNPNVASLCYTYYPDRIIYSLPQSFESAKDSWFVYLANNYKEFKDQVSGVKNFARTGIFITFKNSSPQLFQGVDQLQTEAGVKVTLGDGGLFTQTPQSVAVADAEYEYGSCQNKRSVVATPAGMFYISQNQGKIFKFGQDLDEISQLGLKWWFVLYLPYKLTEDFPDYPHQDNPVAGIGCQSMYNNRDGIVYFAKKDYKLKPEYAGRTTYDAYRNEFIVDNISRFRLGDPLIFHNASWTVSFDPKSKFYVSFHDWHPDLMLGSKITFMSTKGAGIWVHNNTCTQFCNFYDTPTVMEIELPITTGQTVTTLRSVEYILEAYRRYDCVDQFHILDQNFDHAFIYNSEQVSGHLHLNIFPKNNITLAQQYPIINPNSIDILFSKEENKYRFNQFWDVTKDRGEFPVGSNYPPTGPVIPGTTILQGPKADERIWITEPNGYIRDLNPANLDYTKAEMQRKKFRHYLNYLVLRKDIVGDVDMILKLTNAKQVYSPR
jgi:hypothetical protein